MFTLLFACSTEPPPPAVAPITSEEATAAAVTLVCEAATNGGQSCTAGTGTAGLAGGTLTVEANVRDFVTVAGRELGGKQLPSEAQLVMDLRLSVDGTTVVDLPLTHAAGDVDVQIARTKVLDETLQRGLVGHGLALIDALGGDPSAPALAALGMQAPAGESETMRAWGGYPMLSGIGLDPKAAGRMGPQVGTLLTAAAGLVEGEGLHTVHMKATLGGPGGPGPCGILPPVVPTAGASTTIVPLKGTLTVDGAEQDICVLSEPVSWPLPGAGAELVWEHFVVVAPKPPAAETPED